MWLKNLSWYKRIGIKISILTSILVIVFISFYVYFSIQNQRGQLIEEVIRSVNLLSDTIKLSTRKDMLLYIPDRLHQLVDTIGTQPFVEKIRIFNSSGGIIYSSDRSEMHSTLDKRAEQCYACHSAEKPLERLGTPERTRIFPNASGYRVLGMINPIYNEPDCYNASCHVHPPDQKVLGVLDIDISLQPLDERIKTSEARLLLMGVATVFSLAILIVFFMNRYLNSPLNALIRGTRRVAHGDLETHIPIYSDDELGVFAKSFNQMTDDLKRAKNSLTEWGEWLEQMVSERTRALEAAQQQLVRSEKLASLGKLAAGVAHEINNPLTGVLTFSQLLQDQFSPESQQYQDLKIIVQETIRCRSIVRGLLEFSRQRALDKSSVELNDLVDHVLQIVSNQESFQNIRIEKIYDPAMPVIASDKDQLKQVMLNIIVNASDAMPNGGILKIRTQWNSDRSEALLQFEDSGCGIDPEHMNRLFDPFFTTKEMGTGLGLAVSYGIVKAHRGNIEISSKPGEGSTVTVTLPVERLNEDAGS